MAIEKVVDLHEAKIDNLGDSLKKLELSYAISVESLKNIKERITDMQTVMEEIKTAQINQNAALTSIPPLQDKVAQLLEFKLEVEKKVVEENARRAQIKGVAKFLRQNWGIVTTAIVFCGLIYGVIETAYNLPSPTQTQELKHLLHEVTQKL